MIKYIYLFFIGIFFLSCNTAQEEHKEIYQENLPTIHELNDLIVDILDTIKPADETLIFPFLEKFEHSSEASNTLFSVFDSSTVKFMTKQNLIFENAALIPWKLKTYNLDFRKEYNMDENRYLGFSVPLFNLNKDSAVIEVNNFGNRLSGSGIIFFLKKVDNSWIVTKKTPSWIE
jgi:hypothetical protein